jgi:predicted CoA-binding protein
MSDRATIDDFLSRRRLAVVGVSSDPKDFSRTLYRELLDRGYDLVPVNPKAAEVEGRTTVPSLRELPAPVEGALVMTPPSATAGVVRDAAAAGIPRVWLHRGAGQGAVTDEALALCREHGIACVPGECPFMFLPQSGWVHRVHALFRRLGGSYPH